MSSYLSMPRRSSLLLVLLPMLGAWMQGSCSHPSKDAPLVEPTQEDAHGGSLSGR